MRFKARFKAPYLDLAKYQAKLQQDLIETVILGAYSWLDAATARIPAWSGASRATFLHLARAIGTNSYSVGLTDPAAPNRINLGIGSSQGSFNTQTPGKVTFTYKTSLRHLIFNEFNNANAGGDPAVFAQLREPGPYGFQMLGLTAYLRVAGDFQLPDARTFIKVRTKRV